MRRNRIRNLKGFGSRFTATAEEVRQRGAQSRDEFYKQQQEEAERPLKEAQRRLALTTAQLNAEIAEAWRDISQIKTIESERLSDPLVDLATGPTTREQAEEAFVQFLKELPEGITLSDAGQQKLAIYCLKNISDGKQVTDSSAVRTCHERLRSLNAYATDEYVEPQAPEPEQKSEPQTQFRSEAQRLENELYNEVAPLASGWLASLRANFDFYPSDAHQKLIFGESTTSRNPDKRGLFYKLNLSPLSHRSYDIIRRWLCDHGYWDAERLLTPDEKLSRSIEKLGTPIERLAIEDKHALVSSIDRLRPRQ